MVCSFQFINLIYTRFSPFSSSLWLVLRKSYIEYLCYTICMKMSILVNDFLMTAYFERKSRRLTQECSIALHDLLNVTGNLELETLTVQQIRKFIIWVGRRHKCKVAMRRYIVVRSFIRWSYGSPPERGLCFRCRRRCLHDGPGRLFGDVIVDSLMQLMDEPIAK